MIVSLDPEMMVWWFESLRQCAWLFCLRLAMLAACDLKLKLFCPDCMPLRAALFISAVHAGDTFEL